MPCRPVYHGAEHTHMPHRGSAGLSHGAKERCQLAAAGRGSADPPDGGPCSNSTRNLGHPVHRLQQMSKLIGGGIGADLDP